MDNRIIIDDLQAAAGNSLEISTTTIKFNEYKISEKGNYIIGSGNYKINNSYEGKNTFKNFGLLFSLINLINDDLPVTGWKSKKMEGIIPTDSIMEWVKKYGFPYDEMNKINKPGFELQHFRYRLAHLHGRFMLWYGLIYDDNNLINKYESLLPAAGNTIKSIKKAFMYGIHVDNFSTHPVYNEENDNFSLQVYTGSLFEAAYFQFYNLITKNIEADPDGEIKHLKKCTHCNNFFWAKNSKKEFCNSKCRKNYWYHKNK